MEITNSFQNDKNLIYIGCNELDEIGEGDSKEKIGSVVGYVIKALNIPDIGERPEDTYNIYCNALQEQLGSFEPRHARAQVKECTKQKMIDGMLSVLNENERIKKFTDLIQLAAETASGYVSIFNLWPSSYNKEYKCSEFVVLKIFKLAENLELVPTLVSCHGSLVGSKRILTSTLKREAFIDLKQKKFVLSKFDLNEIIKACKEESKKWKLKPKK